MKSLYTSPLFFTLFLCAYLASAQNTSLTKQQSSKQGNIKVVTKTVTFQQAESDNDNTIQEMAKFDAYVKKHIHTIPGVHGSVTVSFTNEKNGAITNVKLVKGLSKAADTEALRLVKLYPRWEPNLMGGKPESSKLTVPIVFGKRS